MASRPDLSRKTAIVTGGSRGLGRGVVEALAACGARVIAVARDRGELEALSAGVRNTQGVAGDATDEALADKLFAREQPDLVVLCAGATPIMGPLHELTWDDFNLNWNVDAKGTFVWTKLALRRPMKPGGHVIVVSSGAALQGSPASGGYASAKRAQWFMASYAAVESERGRLGLRFHCLLPTLNAGTALGRAGIRGYAERAGVTPEVYAKRFDPQLTPAIMGDGVVDLCATPERYAKLTYRIGGGGLIEID
jgi:NAD(P)-dependent dehydrogenase (short-subunit alcohol dehydrogenase family)